MSRRDDYDLARQRVRQLRPLLVPTDPSKRDPLWDLRLLCRDSRDSCSVGMPRICVSFVPETPRVDGGAPAQFDWQADEKLVVDLRRAVADFLDRERARALEAAKDEAEQLLKAYSNGTLEQEP